MTRLASIVPFLIALVIGEAIVGPAIVWSGVASWYEYRVILPAGTVLEFPEHSGLSIDVPSAGGRLIGAGHADHLSAIPVLIPPHTYLQCPTGPIPPTNQTQTTYSGPPRDFTIDQNMTPGTWWYGPGCFVLYGNVSVTESFELLVP